MVPDRNSDTTRYPGRLAGVAPIRPPNCPVEHRLARGHSMEMLAPGPEEPGARCHGKAGAPGASTVAEAAPRDSRLRS